jgi:predicted nucleotidyltransferase
MKKLPLALMLAVVFTLALSACSSTKETTIESNVPVKEMVDKMITEIEQPSLMELDAEMVKQQYQLDTTLLEDYAVRAPMMNVKTNEIAVFKVKDAKDIPAVETAIKDRATAVQKQFETYLPDQYENAKNYKMVTRGNYVFFVISEKADELVKAFDNFFVQK